MAKKLANKNIVVILLMFVVFAGYSLLTKAGSLEPSLPPAPTMKTLDNIYNKPVWPVSDQIFTDWPSNNRFAVCDWSSSGYAPWDMVLDKETGLIWSRSGNVFSASQDWLSAKASCYGFDMGNRMGWRLPTAEELLSLVDKRNVDGLPAGHPFVEVQSGYYWSATNYKTAFLDQAYAIKFGQSFVVSSNAKTESHSVWVVRGGNGPETRIW